MIEGAVARVAYTLSLALSTSPASGLKVSQAVVAVNMSCSQFLYSFMKFGQILESVVIRRGWRT
jgi:hypothetical protein